MKLPAWLLATALLFSPLVDAADAYPEIKWEALVPKGWDPAREFKELDLAKLKDSDPRAMEALEKMKSLLDNAPTEPALNGRKVKIAGFALPLERKGDKVKEFLLVPYFGACIHTPPPPANQIIFAVATKPLAGIKSMDAVWLEGTLKTERSASPWGNAGYRISVDRVEPYKVPH